jgi:transcriptional regulator with XRE-family HTH domain
MESLGTSGGPSGRDVASLLSEVGPRVLRARKAREMTLDELARASGISVAHLSRLESGSRHPSLATLLNVAAGLGVSISELVEEPEERRPGTVVRGAEAPIFEGESFRFQPLMPEAGPQGLSAAKVIFPVGRAEPEYHRHEGEEWLYVLSGRLRLTLGEEATVLEPGDAAFFDGMLPHAFDVLDEEDVEVLFVAGAVSGGGRAAGRRETSGRLHPFREGHRVVDTELRAMEEGAEGARDG